jgi:hypothetical protein
MKKPIKTDDKPALLVKAEQSVRDLAAEAGSISARDAHEAWRWVLISCSKNPWRQGPLDFANRTHPLLCAFNALPEDQRGHALAYLENENAQQDNRHRPIRTNTEGVS